MVQSTFHTSKSSWCTNHSSIAANLEQKQANPMWYGNTNNLLEIIVRRLRNEVPLDDAEWQAQTDLVRACLEEMVEMSEPTVNPSRGATSRRKVADKLNRAMPHVRSMLTAMRDRDRS